MPANCASCDHPQVREINHRIRDGRPLTDISRWLDELGTPITRQALSRHAKSHIGVEPLKGRRPASGDFLEIVRDTGHEGVASGEIGVTLKDAIRAQQLLDARVAKEKDRDWQLKLALVLSGRVPLPMLLDPAVEAIEGEYRPLLNSGAE